MSYYNFKNIAKEAEVRGVLATFCDSGFLKVASAEGFGDLTEKVAYILDDYYTVGDVVDAADYIIKEAISKNIRDKVNKEKDTSNKSQSIVRKQHNLENGRAIDKIDDFTKIEPNPKSAARPKPRPQFIGNTAHYTTPGLIGYDIGHGELIKNKTPRSTQVISIEGTGKNEMLRIPKDTRNTIPENVNIGSSKKNNLNTNNKEQIKNKPTNINNNPKKDKSMLGWIKDSFNAKKLWNEAEGKGLARKAGVIGRVGLAYGTPLAAAGALGYGLYRSNKNN